MAIFLDQTSNGRLDFGDLGAFDGSTALTLAITVKLTASPTFADRLFHKWGDSFFTQAFTLTVVDTDELLMFISDGGAVNYFSGVTSSVNLTSGSLYRIVVTVAYGSPPVIAIWVNGVSQTVGTWMGYNANITSLSGGTAPLQIGYQSSANVQAGLKADYSEAAIWLEVLPDWMCIAYGQGVSPLAFRRGSGLLYVPMIATSPCVDVWTGLVPTQTAASDASHPSMFYPGTSFVGSLAAAGGGGGGGTIPVFMHHYRQQGAA